MKIKFIFGAFVFLSLIISSKILGQNISEEPFIAPSSDSGENASSIIDQMLSDAIQTGGRLFVIVRFGKGDTNPTISLSRLLGAKTHLTVVKFNPKTNTGLNPERIVFAIGENTEGEGKIEFYSGSRLRLVLLAARNKVPNFTCCEDYFPPSKRKVRRRKN